ncbi:hypothetical protein JQ561_28855 [Bradyrhizobium diazoefficiens]|nr:hypothetical protein [Bradyrhizobium diazoefficiens]MBR0930638.1 hypothetical protein [Bradyrhizobium diazoefficiens]
MAEPDPNYHVLLCAKRYAEASRKLRNGECSPHTAAIVLTVLIEGGQEEAKAERRRREKKIAGEVWGWIQNGQDAGRPLTVFEAECVREYYSVPPIAVLETLSASKIHFMADMFDGWAATRGLDPLLSIKLIGWADGYRIVANAVGPDHEPPSMLR